MSRSNDGIWIIDNGATTLYANARMAEILGTTVEEMTGRPSFEFVYPEDAEKAQGLFDSKSRGNARPFRFNLRRKDGTPVTVDVQGTPMRNAFGEFKGIVGTFKIV